MYTDDKCLAKENTALNVHNGQSLVVNGTAAHGPDVDSQVNSDQGKDNISTLLLCLYRSDAENLLFFTDSFCPAALMLHSIYE